MPADLGSFDIRADALTKEGAGVGKNCDPNPVGELGEVSSAMHMLNEVENCTGLIRILWADSRPRRLGKRKRR